MTGVTLYAPAKVNLGLRILGKNQSGNHDLETLMVKVSLFDVVHLYPEGKREEIVLSGSSRMVDGIPRGGSNLVYRARTLFRRRFAPVTAAVYLEKRIPSQAGLGGGSSDAAAVIRGLQLLAGREISVDDLAAAAVKIGADIPFFLTQGTAIARGVGEDLEPLSVPETWMVLLKPPIGMSTKEAYGFWDSNPVFVAPSPCRVVDALHRREWSILSECLVNDLGEAVFPHRPDMQDGVKALTDAGCLASTVSGSGSTLLGICSGRSHAASVGRVLAKRYPPGWFCRVVKTLDGNVN